MAYRFETLESVCVLDSIREARFPICWKTANENGKCHYIISFGKRLIFYNQTFYVPSSECVYSGILDLKREKKHLISFLL